MGGSLFPMAWLQGEFTEDNFQSPSYVYDSTGLRSAIIRGNRDLINCHTLLECTRKNLEPRKHDPPYDRNHMSTWQRTPMSVTELARDLREGRIFYSQYFWFAFLCSPNSLPQRCPTSFWIIMLKQWPKTPSPMRLYAPCVRASDWNCLERYKTVEFPVEVLFQNLLQSIHSMCQTSMKKFCFSLI